MPDGSTAVAAVSASRPMTALASTVVEPGVPAPNSDAPRVDPDAPTLDLNATPDRYDLRTSLGEGGMGEVRLCKDKRIGREVAMKIVRRGSGSRDDLRSRFLREARVQGQLEHPAIVPVYDLGVDATGNTYFTMKRVRGLSLEQILDALRDGDEATAQKYSRRKLLAAFDSVCLAVHFAHTRGVLHRDLKPANVMLGDFGEVYVLDWGLAKIVGVPDEVLTAQGAASDGSSAPPQVDVGSSGPIDTQEPVDTRTAQGAIMGTPGFMSPEQLRGEVDRLDARSDVYALGAMLFELLTLVPLHARSSVPAIVASTLEGVDARPSTRAPGVDVPPELEALCVKATALDPAERCATARALSDAIERYLDGDRDTARRRELAIEHAQSAAQAADRALADGTSAADAMAERSRAIAQVGRALALDPAVPDAIPTLVKLLSEPPREVPAEVRAQMEVDRSATRKVGALTASGAYLAGLALVPVILWIGVRSWAALITMAAAFVLGVVNTLRGARYYSDRDMPLGAVVMVALLAVTTTTMFGPLLVLPMFVVVSMIAFVMNVGRRQRAAAIAITYGVMLLPLALQWAGVLPPSYAFRDGALVVLPGMFNFAPLGTVALLVAINVATIGISAKLVGRFKGELARAEERVHVFAWQLRQLMPDEARGLIDPSVVPRAPAGWPFDLHAGCPVDRAIHGSPRAAT